jgi:hypothetical protein
MEIIVIILIIEIIVLLSCFACMIAARIFRDWKEKKTIQKRNRLKKLFIDAMQKSEPLQINQINSNLLNYEDLLATVETFDRFFLDSTWKKTRQHLINIYLGKKAQVFVRSHTWRNRLLGLRCIVLEPKQLLNKQAIIPLLEDSKFLIRILAATSMVRAEQKDLVLPVLKRMIRESSMGRFAYRDLFINSGEKTFHWVEEIANQEKDPRLIAVCLDILSTKISGHDLLSLAIKEIQSIDPDCRLSAIKIFSNTPSEKSKKYLTKSLSDANWKIRAEAAHGLGQISAYSSLPELTHALQDPEWLVRLQAATALKSMGKEGREVLYRQSSHQNAEAYEIAKYILALP